MLQKDEFIDPLLHLTQRAHQVSHHVYDSLVGSPCKSSPDSMFSKVYTPTQRLTTSCNRLQKYHFLAYAVMLSIILALPTSCTLSSPMPSLSSSKASRPRVNLAILVAESCDPTFISRIQGHVNQAIENLTSFVRETDVEANPDPVHVSYSVSPFCHSRDVLPALDKILGNSSINAVISLSTYEGHGSLRSLAHMYHKAYVAANTHIRKLAPTQSQSISFWPSFSQCSLMLATVLDLYQWQDLYIIHSSLSLWQDFAINLYFELKALTFRVHLSQAVSSPVASSDASMELGKAKHAKVVVLLCDVADQLLLLQMASVMSMTQRQAFFTFATSPYDPSQDSVMQLRPSATHDPDFISDSRAKGVNILESLFVLDVLFPAETAKSRSVATGHKLRRSAPTPRVAGVTRMASDSKNINLAADRQADLASIPKPVAGFKTRSDNIVYLLGKSSLQQPRNRTTSGVVNNQHDSHIPRKLHQDTTRHGSVFTIPTFSHGHVTHLSDLAGQLLFASEVNNLSLIHPRAVRVLSTHNSRSWDLKFRTKRDTNTFLPSEADLKAIYDTVFLVAYSSYLYSRRHKVVPFGQDLISSLTNLTFPGISGPYRVDQEQRLSFDFRVYDFNVTSAEFEPRLLFQALSSQSWALREPRHVSWPGGVILPPDECFKQSRFCKAGVKASIIATVVILALVLVVSVPLAGLVIRCEGVHHRYSCHLSTGPRCQRSLGGPSDQVVLDVLILGLMRLVWAYVSLACIHRRRFVKRLMTKGAKKVIICSQDLVFVRTREMSKGSRIIKSRVTLMGKDNAPSMLQVSNPNRSMASFKEPIDTQTALYNGDLVHVKELDIQQFEMNRNLLAFMRMCRDLLHENLTPYLGFLADGLRPAIVVDYCSRGSLYDILHNQDFKLDWDFKMSLFVDLVKGVKYLHASPLKFHGHMTSKNCMIDSRFVLKISDYGVSGLMEKCNAVMVFEAKDLLWCAPELLRDEALLQRGSAKGDIYSMSIIFQEMALRTEPYDIVKKLKQSPPVIRPSVTPQAAPPIFIQTMKQCWCEVPDKRPSINEVYDQFKKLTGGKKANIVDTMLKLMEKYSTDLEDIVAERTLLLEEEQKKTDQLLARMLPKPVVESLKLGKSVEAESFDEVTIYFSDIVGFTTISAMSTPMQVVGLLNDLYTMFDDIIDEHDVYKVETIGDAYMLVSGLPLRNGNRHAGEIATLALMLLSRCGKFTISHMPDMALRLRIGLHTGSCVAGVVGQTMPRFCLFGDTVNTASRLESTGAAFRIHISEACKKVLDTLGGYTVEYRGQTDLKGKGIHNTYWLLGKDGLDLELPEPPPLIGDTVHGLDSIREDINTDLLASMDPSKMDACDKSCSAPTM